MTCGQINKFKRNKECDVIHEFLRQSAQLNDFTHDTMSGNGKRDNPYNTMDQAATQDSARSDKIEANKKKDATSQGRSRVPL